MIAMMLPPHLADHLRLHAIGRRLPTVSALIAELRTGCTGHFGSSPSVMLGPMTKHVVLFGMALVAQGVMPDPSTVGRAFFGPLLCQVGQPIWPTIDVVQALSNKLVMTR